MDGAVKILDFETAAILRDEILELEKIESSISQKRSVGNKSNKASASTVKNPRNKDLLR